MEELELTPAQAKVKIGKVVVRTPCLRIPAINGAAALPVLGRQPSRHPGLVELSEGGKRQVDLAAHLDDRRPIRDREFAGDRRDGEQVARHVFPNDPVATGGTAYEHPVLVGQRDREAGDLRFDHEVDLLIAVSLLLQDVSRPATPRDKFLASACVGQRQHLLAVADLGEPRRRGGAHRLGRRLRALQLRVRGLEQLPDDSCVLVANHSSYLDGVVMAAALPPRFSFVIKREATDMPVMGFLLRRIGSEFVDRHSAGGRQRGARRVMKRAEQGHSLVFFPEGTFDSAVGLKRFHIGAFVAAARGGVPLVPAVILGARRSMPNGAIVPMPGTIRVEILPSIEGVGREPDELRDAARDAMLARPVSYTHLTLPTIHSV